MPVSKKRPAKSRPARSAVTPGRTTAAPGKELKPWQLAVFIMLGLIVAGAFVGVGFAKKSHDEYGQWPWARTAVPPKMYYDHWKYAPSSVAPLTKVVKVGTTPGGGAIYAPSAAKTPAPPTIQVQSGSRTRTYTIAPDK